LIAYYLGAILKWAREMDQTYYESKRTIKIPNNRSHGIAIRPGPLVRLVVVLAFIS
jgi:hypothetical protein